MQPILSMSMWTSLSNEEREKIRVLFSIPRSSHVVVSDGRIETDGTTPEDFKHLTVEKMQKYLNSTSTDFHDLFFLVVQKIKEPEKQADDLLASPAPAPAERKKPGRKPKAKK